jgi:hypothetical protein
MFTDFRTNIIASFKRHLKPLSSGDPARGAPLYRARPFAKAEWSDPYVLYVSLNGSPPRRRRAAVMYGVAPSVSETALCAVKFASGEFKESAKPTFFAASASFGR